VHFSNRLQAQRLFASAPWREVDFKEWKDEAVYVSPDDCVLSSVRTQGKRPVWGQSLMRKKIHPVKHSHRRPGSSRHDEDTEILLVPKRMRSTPLYEDAIRDTIEREATGSPVVTDGQRRNYHNFCTYCAYGLPNTAPDGFKIPFSDGHTRRLLRLACGPFRYRRYAASRRGGDMGYDVRFRHRGAPVHATVAGDSLCQ
jgi:hypothetical protein